MSLFLCVADEAIQRMVEELKKDINQQTGEPLSEVENIQRWHL